MRILITGIAGHLGSSLARWILQHQPDVEVHGIDDLSCGYPANIPDGRIQWARYSLGHESTFCFERRCEERLCALLAGVDVVFHFAAYAAEGLSPWIRKYDCRNNLVGTLDLINAAVECGTAKRFVFASSMSVYGRGVPPFDELDPRRPIDPYGISKSACEQHLEAAHAQFGLPYTIIRPHNVYGPGQSCWQRFRNVLAHWCARAMEGKPLLIYGDGRQERAFSYIDDVVPCLWRAAVEPAAAGQIINLGGGVPTTIAAAAELLAEITGARVSHVSRRHEVKHAWCTTAKSEEILGYRELTPLNAGLAELWRWCRWAWQAFPERRGTHRVAPLEVERDLYPFWREYV
ncbi:MAG TPA: NAD-dependent epimerase/dehydratase family protein [Pirellulales bacterium]|nr:NAD-dependent epimerase/dehydratase family protein [Pirellulales bacterium]